MKKYVKKSGFTLIEVIASLALLAILAATFLSIFSFSIDGIFTMGRKSEALKIAEKCINAYLENVDENKHYDDSDLTQHDAVASMISQIQLDNPGYAISIDPNPLVVNSDNLYPVTVIVKYRNNTREVKVTTVLP